MNLAQVFYVSRASHRADTAAVQGILSVSRRNNQHDDLTGCLLYSGSCFAQVLEGDADAVARCVARIGRDARHCDVRMLVERAVTRRAYTDWSMGYVHDLDLQDLLEALLVDPTPRAAIEEVMARLRPDTVMGALA